MYQIINTNNGETVGYAATPRYIKRSQNGSFVQTKEKDAQGIAYNSVAYNLSGKDGLGAEDTVFLVEIDEGSLLAHIDSLLTAVEEIEDALCEIDKEENVNE